MKKLSDYLKEYVDSDYYPLHMPGHKRNPEMFNDNEVLSDFLRYDLTEIKDFDNLHEANGIIKDAQQNAAFAYGSRSTYFLINGSTSGILSAISAVSYLGDTIIMARNSHKSAYNAAYVNRLNIAFVYPELINDFEINGPVSLKEIKSAIDQVKSSLHKACGIFITSPTYDGIVSDIEGIVELAHSENIPVIVDEAHGAHFGFNDHFPKSAINALADIVIQSVHKTLPAPTQTAIIHNNSDIISDERLQRYLKIYQSSSPSYVLMAGIDNAVRYMQKNGNNKLDDVYHFRKSIESQIKDFKHIKIYENNEPGKLVISVKDTSINGYELADILREEYHIEVEMSSLNYVLGMLTIGDTLEGVNRLINALKAIDSQIEDIKGAPSINMLIKSEAAMPIYKAYDMESYERDLYEAVDNIAADIVCLYPPGIPIIIPGEKYSTEHIQLINECLDKGYEVLGVSNNKVKVIWEN